MSTFATPLEEHMLARDAPSRDEAGAQCFHCGLPVSTGARFAIAFDGHTRPLCCAGCEAVARTILDAGLDAYYRERTATPGVAAGISAAPDAAVEALFDLTAIQAQYVMAPDALTRSADLYIEGITCSACVWLAESALARHPGVTRAAVNQITHRASVTWHTGETSLAALVGALQHVGLGGLPATSPENFAARRRHRRRALIALGVALLSMMQVMMFTLPLYFSAADDVSAEARRLMGWAALVLTLPAVLYSARTFFAGAWRDFRIGHASMDLPVALAIVATFGSSCIALYRGAGAMYFDSISMFIFLLLAARYLESWARESSLALIERLTNAAPAVAWVLPAYPGDHGGNSIAVAELIAGQVIRVANGELVAADGSIVEGSGRFDESLLTGESQPVARGPGEWLIGGSLNLGGPVLMRVTRIGEQTVAASLRHLTEQALASRPKLTEFANRIARWVAPATLVLSAAAALAWLAVDASMSFPVAVAVLAVTCPCALALAVPAAQALATTRLAREGLLITRADTLEKFARATDMVFDKTGTVTTGQITIEAVQLFGALSQVEVIAIAAALEGGSPHPIARALARAHATGPDKPADRAADAAFATNLQLMGGAGVEGEIDGVTYRLGHQLFVQQLVGQATPADDAYGASLYLGRRGEWLAAMTLADPLKSDACETIAQLGTRGLAVHLLSGDRQDRVEQVAAALAIDGTRVEARQTPVQKLDYANALKQRGARIVAVGDGVNDAPLLGAAHMSIAIGSGADLTRLTADAVLLSPHLRPLLTAHAVAQKMLRIIHQNFGWAIAYNVIAVPLAMSGRISPAEAAIGMALSSLAVVVNSLRLMRAG
ncbi:MAG: heavy metal translocating P-type ATPase [Betaproteobacteria bacterium]